MSIEDLEIAQYYKDKQKQNEEFAPYLAAVILGFVIVLVIAIAMALISS